ncbi:single-stranded-DNA-specific exonuclease RecJ [soil metagenome]
MPIPSLVERRWTFPELPDSLAVARLRRELRLPEALCRLLVARGHGETESAKAFLRPHAGHLHQPALFAGMGDAVARIRRAINHGETILAHGDYDVDGICSTAIFVRALTMLGARVAPFVPHRLQDGYDLGDAGIRAAQAIGATLIVTGDCGIVAHDAVDRACAAGIDVVVTDHHTPGPDLPRAAAVVNPNRTDCPYPDKGLCGAAIAWKTCLALAGELGLPEERLQALLDLVAIATIADLAPLGGENRTLVRWGLKVLAQTPNPGLRALLQATGLAQRSTISAGDVGFVLGPRINAVGRMSEALNGVQLLLTSDANEAERIALGLEADNRERKAVDSLTLREALTLLEATYDPDRDRGVVLAKEGWHPGVIGIVASRVVERIHRPTVMIALDGTNEGKGSARSVPGFHLFEAMRDCREHLTRFGGHKQAAGCAILPDQVEGFRAAFNARARAVLTDNQLVPEIAVDVEVSLGDADLELVRLLRHAGPFGMGNPTPTFAVRGVYLDGTPRVVGQNHLKLALTSGDHTLDAIGFGMGDRVPGLTVGPLDVAFRLEENSWNGRTTVQAKLVDLRPAAR